MLPVDVLPLVAHQADARCERVPERIRVDEEGMEKMKTEAEMSTSEHQIEREIVIEAPAEVVWRTITEPDQISLWFADREGGAESRARRPRLHGVR